MNESIHDLVELYAVGALEADELVAFESHLRSCEQCAISLSEMTEFLTELENNIAVDPPPGLRASVMDEIQNTPQIGLQPDPIGEPAESGNSESGNVIDLTAHRERRLSPAMLTSVAAAFTLIVIGALAFMAVRSTTTFDSVAQAADAEVIDLQGDSDAEVTVAWSESEGQLAVMANGLDSLSGDLTYELWFFEEDQPVPAGLFVPNDEGVVEFVGDFAGDPSLWAITVEQAGGADVPTTTPIFIGEL